MTTMAGLDASTRYSRRGYPMWGFGGDQRVPPVEAMAFGDQAIAAGRRQSADLVDRGGFARSPLTIR
jgi:hypothetical protein